MNAGANTSTVIGNYFGTDLSGSSALGNTGNSMLITGSSWNNTIGSPAAGASNVLSGGLDGATSLAIATGSSSNLIQNFPVLTRIQHGSTTIEGILNSTSNASFTIDFYSNTECDASIYGEGETWLGSEVVTTDAEGVGAFSPTFTGEVPTDHFVTATATDDSNNTSEFSRCLIEGPDLEISAIGAPEPASPGAGLSYTVTVKNYGLGDTTGVIVDDALPTELSFVSSNFPCTLTAGVASCQLGDLPTGDSAQLIINTAIDSGAIGPLDNNLSVTANEGELIVVNNTVQVTTELFLFADGFESGTTGEWSQELMTVPFESDTPEDPRRSPQPRKNSSIQY